MPVESKKLAVFEISRDRLIKALTHISNISEIAAVGLIVMREEDEDNNKGGISFNNVLKSEMGPQFDLFASYPIFNSDMRCSRYLIEDTGEWPVYYIACSERFIKSICTLPPIVSTDETEQFLEMVFYTIKDGNTLKSETVIFGDHKASVDSIIEHSDLEVRDGKIVYSNGKDIEADWLKSYT